MLILEVTKVHPHFGIRSKAIFFIHRMIEVMGIGIYFLFF
jgi:hypothetical protein